MEKLILIGASNFGDEMVQLFRDINKAASPVWDISGFLDDDASKHGLIRNGIPVLGGIDWITPEKITSFRFLCCIGSTAAKKRISGRLEAMGTRFAIGVHPNAVLSDHVEIGEGTVITAGNIVTTNVRIGKHVIVNLACTIGHYTEIGDYCTINPGVNISGDVTLGRGVLLGTNSTILEKQSVGEFSIIGAGAVVTKSIPERVTAVGIPAKVIKQN